MTEIFSRPQRLAGYDYTQPGAYFITINTHKKNNLSGYLANNSVDLNIFGIIASSCWREIPVHFANTQLDEFIFMPNHMLGIIWIAVSGDTACCVSTEKQQGNLEKFGKPVKKSIPTIIRSYKSAVTRLIHREKEDLRIWQSNYFEHVIRNNDDLDKTREYIHYNAFNRLDI
jgi:putative transposase